MKIKQTKKYTPAYSIYKKYIYTSFKNIKIDNYFILFILSKWGLLNALKQ
jgi:hypothetical protein